MDKRTGYEYALEQGYIDVKRGSFYKLFKSIARLRTLSSTEKFVLTIVMSYTDSGKEFYMSNKNLAMESGMDYTSVIRAINSLRDKGYVKTYKVIDKNKKLIVGRTITPQKQFMVEEIAKTWDDYEYEEYGTEETN